MVEELEVIKLYSALYEKVCDEYKYISNNEDIDSNVLEKITMNKRILRDKIEKKSISKDKFTKEQIEKIKEIITEIFKKEEENRKKYEEKLDKIKKELAYIDTSKKLRSAYFKDEKGAVFLDEKK